jgi:hypothetical protein
MAYSVGLFRSQLRRFPAGPMYRFIRSAHTKTPLAFIDSTARFNDPRTELDAADRFRVIYASNRVFTSLWEASVRDSLAETDTRYIARRDIDVLRVVELLWTAPLTVLDIRSTRYLNINASPNVVKTRHNDYGDSQHFAAFVIENLPECDGILYSSRYTERACLALFHRAADKVQRPATVRDPYAFADVRSAMTTRGLPLSVVIEHDGSDDET